MECYLAIKKNEPLLSAVTWMDLENLILTQVRQRKILYHLHLISEENKHTNSHDTCTPMFKAVLSTVAKIRKQSMCPSTDEWIKKT